MPGLNTCRIFSCHCSLVLKTNFVLNFVCVMQAAEDNVRSPVTGVKGSGEPPKLGVGN